MLVTKVGKEIKLIPRVETSHCKADGAREMDVLRKRLLWEGEDDELCEGEVGSQR